MTHSSHHSTTVHHTLTLYIHSYFHPECFALPTKLKKTDVTEDQFVEELLQDNSTDHLLGGDNDNDNDFKDQLKEQIQKASTKTPKKRVSVSGEHGEHLQEGSEHAAIAKMKSHWAFLQGDEELPVPPPSKKKLKVEVKNEMKVPRKKGAKAKTGEEEHVPPASEASTLTLSAKDKEAAEAYGYYSAKTNDELHDVLRWNLQLVSGKKVELLERVVDGHLRGRLNKCPTCTKGKLKLDPKSNLGRVMCPGYFDEDLQARSACLYAAPIDQAPRSKPWHSATEPTEAQKKEMEQAQTKAADSKKETAVTLLLKCVQTRQGSDDSGDDKSSSSWDLKSPKAIKQLARTMVDACRDTGMLNVPEDDKQAKMEIGKVLLQHKSPKNSKEDVCGHLVDALGLRESKAETKAKEATMEAQCQCPANGPLYAAFSELMTLYFKDGNSNAGASYRKVANAVKELDFEITEDNAKGMSKGKTKIPGIGKGSSDKAYEFVTTGKIEKLEEKRASA
jgi:hypothetical protein